MTKKQKNVLIRIIIAAVFTGILVIIAPDGYFALLYLVPYLIVGHDILRKAFWGIVHLQPCDENFLMATASLGAAALGDLFEAVAVMLLYQVGELFQSIAVGKSRKSIGALTSLRPDYANVTGENGELVQVSPESVAVGTKITVLPGEKIPLDGTVTEGESLLDTSALTGESVPVRVEEGSKVKSGSVNTDGVITVQTSSAFGCDTASQILKLVEEAASRKAKAENFITRFSRYYTPTVCLAALLLALSAPLINMALGAEPLWSVWIYRALTFLVISCPCALVISVPLTFFSGIGGISREGILVKGACYIEALSKVKTCVFDKTGTLTMGTFSVTEVKSEKMTEEKLLYYAASAESLSSHPIAKSIVSAAKKTADSKNIKVLKEVPGRGVIAEVDGVTVLSGRRELLLGEGISCSDTVFDGTSVFVAVNGEYSGAIVLSDTVKHTAKNAVESLKSMGIKPVMLTGDAPFAAKKTAEELKIDDWKAGLFPKDKVLLTEEILKKSPKGSITAFCGDGINDAPVLSVADVGIAMGALGSDAAVEAADVVLTDDNPEKIVRAVKASKKCMRIVYENIVFALGTKILFLILGAVGIVGMRWAVFADVGVMVIAVLNAVRALHSK